MKTVVKIDPEKEYSSAKQIIASLGSVNGISSEVSSLDGSLDNLKTVINVLLDRARPKKRPKPRKNNKKNSGKKARSKFDKLPSEKFPELNVEENIIRADILPECPCCKADMLESGLYKTTEKLEVIPKQYHIVRHKRVIYVCGKCHGSMTNAPSFPSIVPSSNYGDSIIIDAALSKYCDLIPMERYCAMADRSGLAGLPPNSLIGLTHHFAEFLKPVYECIEAEVLRSEVVLGDETPHRMLEGDSTSNWYLWGFASLQACIFQAHGTRSGDVPLEFLSRSKAEYFMSDGYSGYKRALRELAVQDRKIEDIYCNAHAYRYFDEASSTWGSECASFLEAYGKIYELERNADNDKQRQIARQSMRPIFEELKSNAETAKSEAMPASSFEKAIIYFLNQFPGLIKCVDNIKIPLDNNFSERLLRSPVLGRKTWYGTHSKRGARTNAILFSVVETCKINNINPRNYFPWITKRILSKQDVITPYQYATINDSG